MDCLNRDAILAAIDFEVREVKVPEWGGSVYVRTLSGRDRDRLESESMSKGFHGFRPMLAAFSCCDADGKRLFTEADIAALGEKSGVALNRIFNASQKINKYTASDVRELEKN